MILSSTYYHSQVSIRSFLFPFCLPHFFRIRLSHAHFFTRICHPHFSIRLSHTYFSIRFLTSASVCHPQCFLHVHRLEILKRSDDLSSIDNRHTVVNENREFHDFKLKVLRFSLPWRCDVLWQGLEHAIASLFL